MVDVDAFFGRLWSDEGWQERLGDDVAPVIRCLEGLYPAGAQLSDGQAERIETLLRGDLALEPLLAALRAVA